MFKWVACKPNILHKNKTATQEVTIGQAVAGVTTTSSGIYEGKKMVAYIYKNGKFVRVRPMLRLDKKYGSVDSAQADCDIVK